MRSTPQMEMGPVEIGLPDELSLYIGEKTVVKLILDAIEEVNVPYSEYGDFISAHTTFQPAMMLALLTYCYATGVYGSSEIQLGTWHDQMIADL